MDDWQKEFQYLLDKKILSRDEMAYLFGQINSIVERKTEQIKELEEANKILKVWQIKPTEAICLTDLSCRYKKVFKSDEQVLKKE